MSNPFDYVKSINESKQDIMVDDLTERDYAPFVVNRALSYFMDTVFQANEMNRLHHLPKKAQYRFLLNSVRQRKRWAGKWHKADSASDNITAIMAFYEYSEEKARAIADLLTESDMKEIKAALDPGGLTKAPKK